VRRLRADQTAADAQRGEVRLVAGALGELGDALDQPFGIERGADDGLGVEVNDGTLLLTFLGKVPPRSGVVLGELPKLYAYREKPLNIRASRIGASRMLVPSKRASSLPTVAAMTGRCRRPHAAAAPHYRP
jgi:hypothetical protein